METLPLPQAINPHFHPSNPFPVTAVLKTHRHDSTGTLHYIAESSAAAQIGAAFILVSHVEATQAAGRARRDMREFYSKWACVLEGIKLNPTYFSVIVCCVSSWRETFLFKDL